MSDKVNKLLDQIRQLNSNEFAELERAIAEKRWTDDEWDRQMRADAAAGKLDHLIDEATQDLHQGRTRKFP